MITVQSEMALNIRWCFHEYEGQLWSSMQSSDHDWTIWESGLGPMDDIFQYAHGDDHSELALCQGLKLWPPLSNLRASLGSPCSSSSLLLLLLLLPSCLVTASSITYFLHFALRSWLGALHRDYGHVLIDHYHSSKAHLNDIRMMWLTSHHTDTRC